MLNFIIVSFSIFSVKTDISFDYLKSAPYSIDKLRVEFFFNYD